MVLFIIAIPALGAIKTTPKSCQFRDVTGSWRYYKFIYEGQEHPPLSRDLVLTYQLKQNHKSRMHWEYEGQKGFCEREGQFVYKDCFLIDLVNWVNPKNAMFCGSDPDLTVGRQTQSRMEVVNGELHLHLTLAGKPFIYVWKKLPNN